MAANYKISGTLEDEIGIPVASTVELWVSAGASDFLATTAESDETGAFAFVFMGEDLTNGVLISEEDFPLVYVRANIGSEQFTADVMSVGTGGNTVDGNNQLFTLEALEVEIHIKVTLNQDKKPNERLTFTFKALDGDGVPMSGALIAVKAVRTGMDDLSLGKANCDFNGHFKMFMSSTSDEWSATSGVGEIEFNIDHLDSEGTVIESVSAALDFEGATELVEVRRLTYKVIDLNFTGVSHFEIPTQTIADLFTALSITPSSEVSEYLTTNDLTSLKSVRMFGFIDPELFEDGDDKVLVGRLNAHAQLEVATTNTELRERYLAIGYNSLRSIASVARHDFIKAGEELESVSILEKGKLHEVARAQYNVIKNITMGVRANQKRAAHPVDIEIEEKHGSDCGCEDCMSTVSPLAYLADLIIYATGHLQISDGDGGYDNISITQLQDLFHQPFGDLPVACDEMTKKICQYRIGVEILRAYQEELGADGDATHPSDCQNTNITRAERDYLWKAYETLLQLFGTSFDEVRRARNLVPGVDDEEIISIGRRLGLFANPIWLPIQSVSSGVITVNGDVAERITVEGRITIYSEYSNEGSYAASATFASGITTISVTPTPADRTGDPPFGFIECGSANAIHTMLGFLYMNPEDISEEDLELIFGLRNSNRAPLEAQPVSMVEQWRLTNIRENWRFEDSSQDEFSTRKRPIIDPDTISLDDLRYPEAGDVLTIWNARREELDTLHGVMRSKVTPKGVIAGLDRFIIPVSEPLNSDALPVVGSMLVVTDTLGCDGTYNVVNATTTYIEVKEVIPYIPSSGNLKFQFSVDTYTYNISVPGQLTLTGLSSVADEIDLDTYMICGDHYFEITDAVASGSDCIVTFNEIVGVSFPTTLPLLFVGKRVLESAVLGTESSIRGFRVKGDFEGDLDAKPFTVVDSSHNDGNYEVVASGAVFSDGYTTIDIGSDGENGYLKDRIEDGFVQYSKFIDSLTVNLGNNAFHVADRDLTSILIPTSIFKVLFSGPNDSDYEVMDSTYDPIKKVSILRAKTAIQATAVAGNIRVVIGFTNSTSGSATVTISGNVEQAIINELITFRDLSSTPTLTDIPLTVSSVVYDGSSNTTVTFTTPEAPSDSSGYALTIDYPISNIDLTGKGLNGIGSDLRGLLFPGMELSLNTGSTDYPATVQSVMVNRLFISTPFMATTTDLDAASFTFQPKLPIVRSRYKIQGTDSAFEYMEDSALENPDGQSTWTISTPLSILATNLRTGVNIDTNVDEVQSGLNLTLDAFLTLMDLAAKDERFENGDTASELTDKDWESFFNILLSAVKRNFSSKWIIEEAQALIALDPQKFWRSQREPQVGNWPYEIDNGLPMIDPTSLSLSSVPDAITDNGSNDPVGECKEKLIGRKERLNSLLARLDNGEFGNYSSDLIRFFFGGVSPMDDPRVDLRLLRTNLNNVDPEVSEMASTVIENELKLAVKDFSALMGYFDRLDSQGYVTTSSDKAIYHPMLVSVYCQRFLHSEWKADEYGIKYYHVRRPQLPQWRTSARIRNSWIEALEHRSTLPVIDPDVVKYSDFTSFSSTAFNLWLSRRDELETIVSGLGSGSPTNELDWIKAVICDGIKFRESSTGWVDFEDYFLRLTTDEDAGVNISTRIGQLGLTASSYRRLRKLYETASLSGADDLTDSEKEEVKGIASGIRKRRLYAQWRDEETAQMIINGPDYFKLDPMAFYDHPFDPNPILKWRTSARERRDWLRILQTRIEDETATKDALAHMVAETEDLTLRILRDALIQLCGDPEKFLYENAEDLTTRFMFDFKTTCCQRTTRISQAIDTLQMLIWTERRGLLEEGPLDLNLNAPEFDAEWKWIGSYSTWRSAMFVFIFPENLLYPTLKRLQSSGFSQLSDYLRSNPRITPQTACKAAQGFSDYVNEISHLVPVGSANTRGRVRQDDCCDSALQVDALLFFSFARCTISNKIYWSYAEHRSESDWKQGFWREIEAFGTNVERFLGAQPFNTSLNQRFIYLFATLREKNELKLAYVKYDLDKGSFDDSPFELELPEGLTESSKLCLLHSTRESVPPTIYAFVDGQIKLRSLEIDGANWQQSDSQRAHWMSMVNEDNITYTLGKTASSLGEFFVIKGSLANELVLNDAFRPLNQDFDNVVLSIRNRILIVHRGGIVLLPPPGTDNYWYTPNITEFSTGLNYIGGSNVTDIGFSVFLKSHENPNLKFQVRFTMVSCGSIYDYGLDFDGFSQAINTGPFSGTGKFTIWSEISDTLSDLLYLPPGGGHEEGGTNVLSFQRSSNNVVNRGYFSEVVINDSYPSLPGLGLVNSESTDEISPRFGKYDIPCGLEPGAMYPRMEQAAFAYLANQNRPKASNIELVEEVFYFVPMLLGLTLQSRGHYIEALDYFTTVYDFRQTSLSNRKIWYGLRLEESITESFAQSSQWLLDPLNPHQLAASRPNSYSRYTILAIIRCLLEYADSEFTIDTVESVSRARELYRQALELLDVPELALKSENCHCDDHLDEVLRRVSCELEPEQLANWMWAITATMQNLESYDLCPHGDALFDAIADLIIADADSPFIITVEEIEAEMEEDLVLSANEPDRFEDMIGAFGTTTDETTAPVFGFESVDMALYVVGNNAASGFERRVEHITGKSKETATDTDHNWLETGIDTGEIPVHYHPGKLLNPDMRFNDPMAPSKTGLVYEDAARFPNWTQEYIDKYPDWYVPTVNMYFCVPDNPVISALRMRAELNLFKLRNCMNIAGMKRELDPYAAPTDTVSGLPMIGAGGQLVLPGSVRIRPTQYRYEVIIERAKQLVALAQQMEANFLAALEKRDAEYYNRMKAKQDLNLSKAQVKLQDLRIKVAEGEVKLAELQRDKSRIMVEELQGMIEAGLLAEEQQLITLHLLNASLTIGWEVLNASVVASQALTQASTATYGIAAAMVAAGTTATMATLGAIQKGLAAGVNASIQNGSLFASQARREQEWNYQISMATQDIAIGNQGIAVAQSRLRVAGQEKRISEMQVDNAEATVEFLNTKFTNVDLYDWMSGVLEGVYGYFLQQATATAKMAQGQLAFERQELPPGFIVDDYWEFPVDSMAVSTVGSGAVDRRGMTGSARLLQDITKLDQYAFDTDKRKLQITRTFSLARMTPIEFQRFRETGVLTFNTSMEHFDRDFAGHYLRLIREVRVSVIALTPSTEGIRATLTSSGVSRTVIGGDVFQTVAIRRDPEVIAFSGTRDANGLFQMQPNDRFMKPFEGSGVEMFWELRLPRESNLFDFGSIADVLFTIDYTAFNDFNYRQQVLRNLPPFHSAEMPFSFRGQFPDQFYQLANPEVNDDGQQSPITVQFDLRRSDFPPNVNEIRIKEVKLYLATDTGESLDDLEESDFTFGFIENPRTTGSSGAQIEGVKARVLNNLITPMNNPSMAIFRNKEPFGTFSMEVPTGLTPLLRDGKVLDIMFVVTYTGEFPVVVS